MLHLRQHMADLLESAIPETVKAPLESLPGETNVQADKRTYEQLPQSKEQFLEQQEDAPVTDLSSKIVRQKGTSAAFQNASRPMVRRATDEVTVQVEKILEADLGPLYASLPEEAKPLFKQKGEEAADQIAVMVRSLKLEVSKVIRLIHAWLLTIPKINKFFLEQEAKIKTDALVEYVEARKQDSRPKP